jgi:hypothetical protein
MKVIDLILSHSCEGASDKKSLTLTQGQVLLKFDDRKKQKKIKRKSRRVTWYCPLGQSTGAERPPAQKDPSGQL